jgi:hypothetical protein
MSSSRSHSTKALLCAGCASSGAARSVASDQSSTAAEQANNRPVPRADRVLRIGQFSLRTLYGWPGRLQEKRTESLALGPTWTYNAHLAI